MWIPLTTMLPKRQFPTVIGRLNGEAKTSAMTLSTDRITSDKDVKLFMEHLDKLYAVNGTARLELDVAAFFDYYLQANMTVEQSISGFHNRPDAITELQMNVRLKVHLLLRQAQLNSHSSNLIVGAASGSFEVEKLATALRQAFCNTNPPASMNTFDKKRKNCADCKELDRKCGKHRQRKKIGRSLDQEFSLPIFIAETNKL